MHTLELLATAARKSRISRYTLSVDFTKSIMESVPSLFGRKSLIKSSRRMCCETGEAVNRRRAEKMSYR